MRAKQCIVYVICTQLWYDSFKRLQLTVAGEKPARGITYYPDQMNQMTLQEFLEKNAELLGVDLQPIEPFERFALFKGDPYHARRPIFVSPDTVLGECFNRQFLVIYSPPDPK